MGTDIHWIKKIGSILILALVAIAGVALPPELI